MKHIFWFSAFCCLFASTQSVTPTESAPLDLVDISCDGEHTEKILYTYVGRQPYGQGMAQPQTLEYELDARETISGSLTQNIRINGNGKCFDLFVRLR